MRVITKKTEIKQLLDKCFVKYNSNGLLRCVEELNILILSQKVKFPLLEYCGEEFYNRLPKNQQLQFCDKIESLKTEGGNVILGIMLQKRLQDNFIESINKATEYIAAADIWYVCDIIGERVFGFSLLHNPKITIPQILKLSKHQINWVIRSLGAGVHYAIKKGLDKNDVKTVFELLLTIANTKDKEIRQGIGWAAKTTAKFHPEVIQYFQNEIQNEHQVANWFRAKIEIGLNRNNYAKGN
ncbi:DNA alkylation repair protein [uncultured Lacinutrix sp.]|uniref:DNA alkylation repair protein n=1 Tax=uncultured Lacinutrix sp. TaxID=574032 RepID=UPI002618186E|nr:DNA alkylation repair protein [uncultured Lacinutrix sp.]